jgi:predicted GTPase
VLVVVALAAGASIAWRLLPEEETEPGAKLLRMEVVNGCGTPRVGRAVADELQMRGFDVYAVRAARERSPRTTVVDLRDPTGRNAERMARALSVQRHWRKLPFGPRAVPETRIELDSSRYLEVRLVVGADYRRFFADVVPLY